MSAAVKPLGLSIGPTSNSNRSGGEESIPTELGLDAGLRGVDWRAGVSLCDGGGGVRGGWGGGGGAGGRVVVRGGGGTKILISTRVRLCADVVHVRSCRDLRESMCTVILDI